MRKGLLTFVFITCLTLSGCSIIPNHNPQSKNYAVSFSYENSTHFPNAVRGQYQTQFDVNVSEWNQNYDQKNCEVFLIVTNRDSAPVVDLETSNPNYFAYGGAFNLDVENPVLKSLGVQPIDTTRVPNNWLNVVNTTQATSRFIARTDKLVKLKDWRFVILAFRGDQSGDKVLWTKVVSPS